MDEQGTRVVEMDAEAPKDQREKDMAIPNRGVFILEKETPSFDNPLIELGKSP